MGASSTVSLAEGTHPEIVRPQALPPFLKQLETGNSFLIQCNDLTIQDRRMEL
jgi:hypothetical protein